MNDTTHELHLIGVAEVHYWHGFDRLIRGLAEYYCTNPDYKVYFHIVGPLSGEREKQEILPVIRDNKLESYVILHGPQHDQQLDAMFEQADFAIGSLVPTPQWYHTYQNFKKSRICCTRIGIYLFRNRRRF